MAKRITREEEALLPEFSSWADAKAYFRAHYPDCFLYAGNDGVEGGKIWTYHLLLDYRAYVKGMREMRERGSVSNLNFINSYQLIEIDEQRNVHIVH